LLVREGLARKRMKSSRKGKKEGAVPNFERRKNREKSQHEISPSIYSRGGPPTYPPKKGKKKKGKRKGCAARSWGRKRKKREGPGDERAAK